MLDRAVGPVLDVGCGPGRMLHAAAARAIPAVGIDVVPHAVARARGAGGLALHRSVFARLPLEGRWRSVLLMDGNIGIGGDPSALLHRCGGLAGDGGTVLVEVEADPGLAIIGDCTVVDGAGRESAPFAWARVGRSAIREVAADAGLTVVEQWESVGRHFVRIARPLRTTSARERTRAFAATATTTAQITASAIP
ncbi:methyltransferase type 12 [Agromyces marinus]|uniref:Methyltransferase type 12 n=1 Tax=Agromyces marinus TaxID=1389020 RepID=A0ABN6YB06_9MICO|nr:class I SAM-dependent methyltransferase [Agromyces marinus]BDZ54532.1 methyltransferase type 12 [Agromyces marinus]